MANRIGAVLMTYLTRPLIWVNVLICAVAFLEVWRAARDGDSDEILPLMAFFFGLFPLFTARILLDQFTNCRSRTLPAFAKPHLIVAALWTIAVPLLACVACARLYGGTTAGLLCLSLAFGAAISWSIYLLPPALFGVIPPLAAMVFMSARKPLMSNIESIADGDSPTAVAMLLAFSLVSFAALGAAITRITEESPAYQRARRYSRARGLRDAQGQRAAFADLYAQYWRTLMRLLRLESNQNVGPAPNAGPIRLWRETSGIAKPSIVGVAFAFLAFSMTFAQAAITSGREPLLPGGLLFMQIVIGSMMMAYRLWMRRSGGGYELLMPIPRRAIIRQWIAATAFDMFTLWAWTAGGVAAASWIVMIFSPHAAWPLLNLVPLSFAAQVAAFCVGIWAASNRSSIWLMGAFTLPPFAYPLVFLLDPLLSPVLPDFLTRRFSTIIPIAAAIVPFFLAATLGLLGYIRLLRAELGRR